MFLKGLFAMLPIHYLQYQDIEEEDIEKLLQKDSPSENIKSVLFAIEIKAAVNHLELHPAA